MKVNDHAPFENYKAKSTRYNEMPYRRCGNSGVQLPAFSLGLWHNFGEFDSFGNARGLLRTAFDLGINHFDLANNYGPPYGSAEETLGRVMNTDLALYRDELFISTKAGYDMWPGPYGNGGSRKYIISSLDRSLTRLGLDYVDLFYHHRPDPSTPIEETAYALDQLVKQGKALYIGLSNYSVEQTRKAKSVFDDLGTPFIINQSRYSMIDRSVEEGLLDLLSELELGMIAFSPLAQGMLTDKYLNGIPKNSRASNEKSYLNEALVYEHLPKILRLSKIAISRGQTLAQMSLAWLLNDVRVSSILIGASSPTQLKENMNTLKKLDFTENEELQIRKILEE
ncbi:L-glyceraldehyde 3-phosphate reductase [Alginatibacterium sediminis]|uniref:L-glyceraldehyde 3-phosphate reductase n=1 Tax=Alginatibacterium sediminis TaxID=2164068 RepID=A0A420E9Y7_9ALTE|nr:aldo/keto reductase [Alginatibacterium sediminis]RKF17481.1 L-glyceraldehyde 3-phosphate reductase [Alginatibacterium sediminis]